MSPGREKGRNPQPGSVLSRKGGWRRRKMDRWRRRRDFDFCSGSVVIWQDFGQNESPPRVVVVPPRRRRCVVVVVILFVISAAGLLDRELGRRRLHLDFRSRRSLHKAGLCITLLLGGTLPLLDYFIISAVAINRQIVLHPLLVGH